MFTKNINNLTPIFRNAIEEFIPGWLESLLPYYQEAKHSGDDILELSNVISSEGEHYEKNGIYYCRHLNDEGLSMLAFDSLKGYRKVNWRECLIEKHPDFDRDPDASMGIFCELTKNSLYFDHYVWRLFNRKPPYDDLKNKVDSYFKQLTGDNGVGFSLSSTSMLYFNEKAKWYIDQYRVFM